MKTNWLPSPQDYPEKRLFSLDLLRGLDMFYLAVVTMVLSPLLQAVGADPRWNRFLCTHPWEGFTLYDLIMPLFIFMCGAAIPLALGRRMVDGKPAPGYWRHVWGRVALLWVLGMLTQGDLATLDIHRMSFYNNTLQTIAVGYVATAFVMTIRSWKARVAIPLALVAVYGLLVHFLGDYTKDGNITQIVELRVLRAILPADNTKIAQIAAGGYTWLLPSMMFPVISLAGAFSTSILMRRDAGAWRRAGELALMGAGSLAVGWILAFAGVRMVKHIFTVSFTLQAIGWSALLLAALYALTDIWRFRRGMGLILLFGQFALTGYIAKAVFGTACRAVSERLFTGVAHFFDPCWKQTILAFGTALVVIAVVIIRRRLALAKGK